MQACRTSGDIPQEHCPLLVYFKKKKSTVCVAYVYACLLYVPVRMHMKVRRGAGVSSIILHS